MSRKVIEIGGPGLGDSLSYSTLPEEFHRQFGDEVFIREPTHWNNPEVRALWEANPFVAGFTTDPASEFTRYGDLAPRAYLSWILGMESVYGLKPTNPYPRVYGQPPEIREDWMDKVFIDPRSSSQPFPSQAISAYVRNIAFQFEFDPDEVIVIESPHSGAHGADALPNNPRIRVPGLAAYASVIASCKIFLTVESGGHVFASAIKGHNERPIVCSLFTNAQFADRVFVFSNVIYKPTGFQGRDWHDYA
jgi:hypothetical protein